jgi:hypothetical protein
MTSPQDVAVSGVYNAHTLDDQWLSSLLEVGMLGVAALVWMIVRVLRRLKRVARLDDSVDSWLLTALATGICAYAFGMFTYDAFSFIQVTLMLFVYLGLAAAALRLCEPPAASVAGNRGRDAMRQAFNRRRRQPLMSPRPKEAYVFAHGVRGMLGDPQRHQHLGVDGPAPPQGAPGG